SPLSLAGRGAGGEGKALRPISAFLFSLLVLVILAFPAAAHEDDKMKKLPPSKAGPQLQQARGRMDAAKAKLLAQGRYACCIRPPEGAKAPGCDLCAKENGSCQCGSSLAQGKGVCGECLAGWKAKRGAVPGIDPNAVTLRDSSQQKMAGDAAPPLELAQAR